MTEEDDDKLDLQEDTSEGAGQRELEAELQRLMKDAMGEVSRQRLRALQMALRRAGNMDNRMPAKDLLAVLQVGDQQRVFVLG